MTIGSNSSGHFFDTSLANSTSLAADANGVIIPGSGGGGGVTGPGSSTNNGVATWNGTAGTVLKSPHGPVVNSSTGIMTNVFQPAFFAYLSTNSADVTGDGTVVVVPFDSVAFDQSSGFDTATSSFSCPAAGLYQYNVNIFLAQSGAGTNTYFNVVLLVNGSTQYILYNQNQYPVVSPFFVDANGSILIQNAKDDIVQVQVAVAGNATKNIVVGGGGAQYTTFSGYIVC